MYPFGYDPYQILGVSRGSTQPRIRKIYRRLAMKYYANRNRHDSGWNPDAHGKAAANYRGTVR
jgi:curved DNA-binding protein CbpA